jgi:hypothetical protein
VKVKISRARLRARYPNDQDKRHQWHLAVQDSSLYILQQYDDGTLRCRKPGSGQARYIDNMSGSIWGFLVSGVANLQGFNTGRTLGILFSTVALSSFLVLWFESNSRKPPVRVVITTLLNNFANSLLCPAVPGSPWSARSRRLPAASIHSPFDVFKDPVRVGDCGSLKSIS